jgi:hypothetical protein
VLSYEEVRMNICLIRQDESAEEINVVLGEVTLGRGPLLGVSIVGSVKVQNNVEFVVR